MSKIFNLYDNDLDKTWFDSSNILYAECDDKTNQLKIVRITFKDGSTYQYKDVNVTDYLMFREAASNGKAFFKYIKKYECEKMDKKSVESLQEELSTLLNENNKSKQNIENE